MPELSEADIKRMQPDLRAMFGHSSLTGKRIATAHIGTTDNPDRPLVSDGFYLCTGMVLLYHNKEGQIEPTLIHLSTPYLGGPIREFLTNLRGRMETEGGHAEAVFITGANSAGERGGSDPEAADMRAALEEIIPADNITFYDTIKSPDSSAFGVAYVPPKHRAEGMVCVRDYTTDFITPHFPFTSVGKDVAPGADKGKGGDDHGR